MQCIYPNLALVKHLARGSRQIRRNIAFKHAVGQNANPLDTEAHCGEVYKPGLSHQRLLVVLKRG